MSDATEKQSTEERWKQLANQLVNETDPQRIIDLSKELTEEFDRKRDRKAS